MTLNVANNRHSHLVKRHKLEVRCSIVFGCGASVIQRGRNLRGCVWLFKLFFFQTDLLETNGRQEGQSSLALSFFSAILSSDAISIANSKHF